jgi:hypothetical protein
VEEMHVLLFCYQNAGQIHNLKIATRSYANIKKLKCSGRRVTNKNVIEEEIKSRINMGNDCQSTITM